MAYLGFYFGGGGGSKYFWKNGGICMVMYCIACYGGPEVCSPEKILKNGAIWCVLENILLTFCKNKIVKIFIFI